VVKETKRTGLWGLKKPKEKEENECSKLLLSIMYHDKAVFDPQLFKFVAELTLAPSGDEILPVRSQELQTNVFIQNQLKNIA